MAKANNDVAEQLEKSIKNQKYTMIGSLIFILITVDAISNYSIIN